jgi:L-threonylcarbamoyladenylate synthase
LNVILDGGPCDVGLESTVVDGLAVEGEIRVLRPGGVTVEDMERVLSDELGKDAPTVLVHRRDYSDEDVEHAPTTPGMKYTHYAPVSPVILVNFTDSTVPHRSESVEQFLNSVMPSNSASTCRRLGLITPKDSRFSVLLQRRLVDHPSVTLTTFPLGARDDPATTAHGLFNALLTLDGDSVDIIVVEAVAEVREGLAIMNRVRKAASETRWVTIDAEPSNDDGARNSYFAVSFA